VSLIWATRQFRIGDNWIAVQNIFNDQFMLAGDRQKMMMVATVVPGKTVRLYIGLPDRTLLKNFPGFQEIAEADLPDRTTLVVGDSSAFEARFRNAGSTE